MKIGINRDTRGEIKAPPVSRVPRPRCNLLGRARVLAEIQGNIGSVLGIRELSTRFVGEKQPSWREEEEEEKEKVFCRGEGGRKRRKRHRGMERQCEIFDTRERYQRYLNNEISILSCCIR